MRTTTLCPHCDRRLEVEIHVNRSFRGTRMTEIRKAQLVKLAKEGWSDTRLSDEFKIAKSYVATIRVEGGIRYPKGRKKSEASDG